MEYRGLEINNLDNELPVLRANTREIVPNAVTDDDFIFKNFGDTELDDVELNRYGQK